MKVVVTISGGGCSEAALSEHVERIVEEIRGFNHKSWLNKINTDWDESYGCEIEVERVKE